MGCQVGIFGGCQDAPMAKDFLYFDQIDAGFDQMRGIAVAQIVRGDLFFMPQSATTWCIVF